MDVQQKAHVHDIEVGTLELVAPESSNASLRAVLVV